jgi:hypothetical protein
MADAAPEVLFPWWMASAWLLRIMLMFNSNCRAALEQWRATPRGEQGPAEEVVA